MRKNMSATQSTSMKALKRDPVNKTVRMVSMVKPEQPSHQHVVIKVTYAGICGSDLSIMGGKLDRREDMILGHEISGTVAEVGDGVWTLQPGQKVVISPQVGCGECHYCQRADTFYCLKGALESAIGLNKDGGWREYWELPSRQVVALPEDVPLKTGVLCEPFCCVYRGWERNGAQPQDARVLIMGAGAIGILWASLFHLRGYEDVIITETNPTRRTLVAGLGLGYRVYNPEVLALELHERDMEREGYDLVIDCSGNVKAIQQATNWLRRGGTLNLFGIPPSTAEISLRPSEIMGRSITIVGTLISPASLPRALPTFTTLVRKGYLEFAKLGIKVFDFDDYTIAISSVTDGKVTKAVLSISNQ